jgi:hypothetical protein
MEQREECKGKLRQFTEIIKGKLEETTPKRKKKNNLGYGEQGKTGSIDKQPVCVW